MDELINKLKLQNMNFDFQDNNGSVEIILHSDKLEDINKVIGLIKETNSNVNKVVVDLPVDAPSFGMDYLQGIVDQSIVVFRSRKGIVNFSIDDLIKLENLMDIMVKDIRESDLSPYEKYIAIYDIVRSFKEYRFYEDSRKKDREAPDQSRNVYLLLINEWIVCAGYSQLLNSLLTRIGIPSIEWVVSYETHARNYVHIKDDKYHIDGFYMCDPTWDQAQEDIILKPGILMNMTLEQSSVLDPTLEKGAKLLGADPFQMIEYLRKPDKRAEIMRIIASLDAEFFRSVEEEFNSYGLNPVYDPNFFNGIVPKNEYMFADKICEYLRSKVSSHIGKDVQAKAMVCVQEFINGEKYSDEEFERQCHICAENIDLARDEYLDRHSKKRN